MESCSPAQGLVEYAQFVFVEVGLIAMPRTLAKRIVGCSLRSPLRPYHEVPADESTEWA